MSDRSVSVNLKANVAGYIAGIEQAKLKTVDFAKAASKNAEDHKQSWDKVGKGMMLTGGVIAAGVGLAVKAFADFDKEMSNVKAVSNATARDMDKLGKAALKAGADTKFSASEAAKAEAELAKAGVSAADILGGGLTGSLSLAAAGNLDLADAATISAQAMNIFKLKGSDVGHIADVLAAGANKSAADVQGLGDSLRQGGLVAAQYDLSLEQTVGTLSAFADNALIGSDAGTALKGLLQQLTPTSKESAAAMESIGLSAYDAQGKFVGLESVAAQLQGGLSGLSDQQRDTTLKTIFGADAVRGANILYEQGAAGIADYTQAVNDQGAASRMAATQLDNLAGDLEALKGSVETALIQAGSGGNDVLRDMAKFATGAVNAFGGLPAPIQGSVVKVAALGAAALLTGGALITLVPKAQAAKAAMSDMGVTAGKSGTLLKGLGLAAGVALVAMPLLDVAAKRVSESLGQLAPNAESAKNAITALADGGKASGDSADLINRHFEDLANTVNNTFSTELGHKVSAFFSQISPGNLMGFETSETNQSIEFFKTLDSGLTQMVSSGNGDKAAEMFKKITTEATAQGYSLTQVQSAMPGYTAALDSAIVSSDALATATGGVGEHAAALIQSDKDLAAAADAAKTAHDALTASITGFGSAMLTARGDERGYEAAIDAATEALKKSGETYDKTTGQFKIGTDVQRASEAALDGIATSALKVAESNLTAAEANGTLAATSRTVTADVGLARDAFIKQAHAMGMPIKAAEKLATKAGLTSARVKGITDELQILGTQNPKPTITVAGAAAARNAIATVAQYLSRLRDKTITIHEVRTTIDRQNTGRGVPKAAGGLLTGPGTGTSDSIDVRASNGEFWVNAHQTARNLPLLHAINSGAPGFATGGQVGKAKVWTVGGKEYGSAISARNATASAADRAAKTAAAAAKAVATTKRDYQFSYLPSFAKALTGTTSAMMTAGTSLIAHVAKTAAAHQISSGMIVKLTAENKSLGKLATSRDTLAEQIKSANENLTAAQKTFTDQQTSISSSLGAFDMTKASSPVEMISQLKDQIEAAKAFGAQINTLSGAGLNATMLKQLADAGPAGEGSPLAQMMGATPGQISEINTLMASLQSTAAQTGTNIATSLYGSGVQAAQGLVAGLDSQQKAIEAQMLKIATGMQAAIKQALGLSFAPAAKSRSVNYVSAPTRSQSSTSGSAAGDSMPPINLTTSIVLDNHVLGTSMATWSQKMVRDTGKSGLKV